MTISKNNSHSSTLTDIRDKEAIVVIRITGIFLTCKHNCAQQEDKTVKLNSERINLYYTSMAHKLIN